MNIPSTTPGTLPRAMIRRLAAVSALALTVFGLSVPVASAGESEQIRTAGGKVQFLATGDILRAVDTRRDGYAVRARLTWFDPLDSTYQKEYVIDPNSAGNWRRERFAIPEGITVHLRMCYIDQGVVVRCSKEQDGVA